MDFTFTPEQDELPTLAAQILKDRATNERMKPVEKAARFDRELWRELGRRGPAVPGHPRVVRRRRARPRRALPGPGRDRPAVAPVPLAVHGPAALVLAELGSDALKDAWLPGAAADAHVLTVAGRGPGHNPARPTTRPPRARAGCSPDRRPTSGPAHRGRRCSSPRPPPPPDGTAVFLVDPANRHWSLPSKRSRSTTSTRRRGSKLQMKVPGELVGAVDGHTALPVAQPTEDSSPRSAHCSSASPRARLRRRRSTRGRVSSSGAQSARSRRSPSGLPTGTSTCSVAATHDVGGRLAAERGAARGDRGGDGEAVGSRHRSQARPHHGAHPRRGRHRPRRRGAPILHRRQAHRVRAWWRHSTGAHDRPRHWRPNRSEKR